MPRLIVPRSTRTMYGTVSPAVVVVTARSAGALPGVYGLKQVVVGGGERSAPAFGVGEEVVAPGHHAGQHAAHHARGRIGTKRAGDVTAVERQPHLVQRHALRHAHLDQGVAAADEVRPVREGDYLELTGCSVFCRCRDSETGEQRRDGAHNYGHDSSRQTTPAS